MVRGWCKHCALVHSSAETTNMMSTNIPFFFNSSTTCPVTLSATLTIACIVWCWSHVEFSVYKQVCLRHCQKLKKNNLIHKINPSNFCCKLNMSFDKTKHSSCMVSVLIDEQQQTETNNSMFTGKFPSKVM